MTGRLHKELADEIVGSIMELFSPTESENAWHGGMQVSMLFINLLEKGSKPRITI